MSVRQNAGLALGFDAGSVALKVVVTDLQGHLLEHTYTRTQGRPIETARAVLGDVLARHSAAAFDLVCGTGSAGRLLCELLNVPFVNEVICQATAIRQLQPGVRTLIEMGGQDSKMIFLPEPGSNGRPMTDFAMNTNCAAGTGSFLDQQASRLGIRIEDEFGALALRSTSPPRVAGRCSVFAKSDMIHLQQQAAPVHDIVAGLCVGLARNLKSNLGRAMELPRPIAFCGGVAMNRGVVRALEEVFELGNGGLVVPECCSCTGALGAVLVSLKERKRQGNDAVEVGKPLTRTLSPEGRGNLIDCASGSPRPTGGEAGHRCRSRSRGEGRPPTESFLLEPLDDYLHKSRVCGHRLSPLSAPSDGQHDQSLPRRELLEALVATNGPIDAWLGLDVGSISTKIAVIDKDNKLLAKIYLMTAGRPLEAVRQVLKSIGDQLGGLVRIRGAASTGSGRYLTGDFIGADLVINEITAQATAAAVIDPAVDTIFEIGGQDSKYISLDGGVVVDFEMNHACAAGTGSFLEEQAERLGISIKQQFGQLAFSSQGPIRLGERCTVFMESDLLSHLQQGAKTEDLVAGLCYSIVSNYINRVVGHRRIGKRIFFQGGTAFNAGVVAAFEKVTGRRVTVPPHHEVTGAIGAAVLARRYQEQQGRDTSNFGGFELAETSATIRSFECDHCSNHCEINEVTVPGRDPLYYGSRCDRYNVKKERREQRKLPNLFIERHRLLLRHARIPAPKKPGRPTMGIPLALSNYQLLPFWGTLLDRLGFNVVVSPASTPQVIRRGVEAVLSTPCFPVKVAHGHVLELIDKGVDYIWLPSVIAMKKDSPDNQYNQACPYVQTIPYQVMAALEQRGKSSKIIKLPVRFQEGLHGLYHCLRPLRAEFGIEGRQLRQAVKEAWQAQDAFEEACRERGRVALQELEADQRAVVVVSRPYNGCDNGVCLDLPGKLRRLGVLAIPMDFLDLQMRERSDDRVMTNMFWKYGQRILRAAEIIRDDPRLHAVYLSNFGCGPDSFIINYFKRLMAPKPSLVLEIDEHAADAGVVTRLEAFLESLNNAPVAAIPKRRPLYPRGASNGDKRTLYIPWMYDGSYLVAAAFRAYGQPAEVMPISDERSIELGRRVCSGKECLPCIITAGDMIQVTQRPDFDPRRAAFFMPGASGPCRFGQYHAMHKLILDELGLPEVPIVALSQDKDCYEQWKQFEGDPNRLAWCGICAADILQRARLALRPYERERGRIDQVYEESLRRVCGVIEKRPSDADLIVELRRCANTFATVPMDRSQRKPRIGVVGEVYVRHHRFANNDLLRVLEQLGAETALAGFPEWMYYTNWTRKTEAWRDKSFRYWLENYVHDRVQQRIQRRINATFAPLLGNVADRPVEKLLQIAEPYLHPSFEGGDAVLSLAGIIEFCHQGCDGVINVMPFTCMPSTIVAGLMKRLTGVLGQMPTLSLSYDGQQDATLQTRLEAFIYQARSCQAHRQTARENHVFAQQSELGASGTVEVG